LITGVQSVEGGKTAVVTFSQPYPRGAKLFNDILPAHIVKDVPGGFAAGTGSCAAVTGWPVPRGEHRPRSATRSCWPATTDIGASPPNPIKCCSAAGVRLRAGRFDRNGDTQVAQVQRRAAAFAATVRDSRRTDRAHRHTARHAADSAGAATHARGFPSAQSDSGPNRMSTCWRRWVQATTNTVTLAQAQVRSPSAPGVPGAGGGVVPPPAHLIARIRQQRENAPPSSSPAAQST